MIISLSSIIICIFQSIFCISRIFRTKTNSIYHFLFLFFLYSVKTMSKQRQNSMEIALKSMKTASKQYGNNVETT